MFVNNSTFKSENVHNSENAIQFRDWEFAVNPNIVSCRNHSLNFNIDSGPTQSTSCYKLYNLVASVSIEWIVFNVIESIILVNVANIFLTEHFAVYFTQKSFVGGRVGYATTSI